MSETEEQIRERIEHRDTLLNIRAVLKTPAGRGFVKYLFKNYDPIFLPQMGLEGPMLHEGLGMRRAHIELFNIIAEADPETASQLLAENVKEKNAELYRENPATEQSR